jgi:DNA repair exonuclease SbcCD nuclease subunit
MAKVAMITDVHFNVRNASQFYLTHQKKFYDEVFFPYLKENGIKHLLFLGDFWEDRRKLDIVGMNAAFECFFNPLEELGIQTYWIYGNHDIVYRNDNSVNAIDFLGKMYKNIHIVKTHEVINIDGLDIAMLSWVNKANLADSLDFINTAAAPILCGHFEIKTFLMLPGAVCDSGFEKNIFERYESVYSGHFHTISSDGRIQYISNPFQTTWSDYGQEKGFRILDTATRNLEFIRNPFELYSKVAYTDDIDLFAYDFEEHRGKVTRVFIQSFANTNQQKFNLFIEKLNSLAHAVDVFEVDETTYSTEKEIEASGDMKTTINQYIDEVVQNQLVKKEPLKQYFESLWSEASRSVEVDE